MGRDRSGEFEDRRSEGKDGILIPKGEERASTVIADIRQANVLIAGKGLDPGGLM